MQCLRCQFENIPGVPVCGQCGEALAGPRPVVATYPPRARDHGRRARAEGRTGLARLRRSVSWLVQSDQFGLADDTRRRLVSATLSVVPGLGQWITGRHRPGRRLFGAAVGAVALGLACWRHPLSNVMAMALVCLSMLSVWEQYVFGPKLPREGLTWLWRAGVAAMVLSCYLSAWVMGEAALRHTYPRFRIQDDLVRGPARGDTVIVDRRAYRDALPARGNLVVYAGGYHGTLVERVLGAPGDRVEVSAESVKLNGQAVPPERWPLQAVTQPVTVTVPADGVWVYSVEAGRQWTDEVLTEEFRIDPGPGVLAADQIQGRVIAILNPPAHRGWVR